MKTIDITNDENGDSFEILDADNNSLYIDYNVGFSILDKLYANETGNDRYIKRIGKIIRKQAREYIAEGEKFEIYYGDTLSGRNGNIELTLADL